MYREQQIHAYIGLGSNCKNAGEMLARSRQALQALPGVRLGAVSPVYETEPQGYSDQAWFRNQVVELFPDDVWTPCFLVSALLGVEAALGRQRSPDPALRFGPRSIDLDLLLFGKEQSRHAHCIVPHPRLTERACMLRPLLDVAPDIEIDGLSVRYWLQRLPWRQEGLRIFQ